MKPDFKKSTIDALAKRAAYICSNPDCRIQTVGPNSDPTKALLIGEAAHIFGARPKSRRFDNEMSDHARSEITNAIWLCRNCHKLIDSDDAQFPSKLLFSWREKHDAYVSSVLGTRTEKIRFEHNQESLKPFLEYPHLIRRIVTDKPELWELRLTSELMSYLNREPLKKIEDLRGGRSISKIVHVDSDEAPFWLDRRLDEMTMMISPSESLLRALSSSWGAKGIPGDANEILHVCLKIREYFFEVLRHEEQFYFSNLPREYEQVIILLRDLVASQTMKINEIPAYIDEVVEEASSEESNDPSFIFEKTIVFDVPKGWSKKYNSARKRAISGKMPLNKSHENLFTRKFSVWWLIVIMIVLSIFFSD